MHYKSRLLISLLMAMALAACGPKDNDGDQPSGTTPGATGGNIDPNANNAYGTGLSARDLINLGIDGNPLNYKVVFFEYNSSAVDQRSEVIARAHARYLRDRGGLQVSLEGHADERGTRDYNLALGERRAQRVADLMKAEGAGGTINTISYGEERPADSAHNEAAWKKNRRVEISY